MYQSEIEKTCEKVFAEINLSGGCMKFVDKLRSGEREAAIRELEAIVRLSISRCISATLSKTNRL